MLETGFFKVVFGPSYRKSIGCKVSKYFSVEKCCGELFLSLESDFTVTTLKRFFPKLEMAHIIDLMKTG